MSASDWTQAVLRAAKDIAGDADQQEHAGATPEWLGRILVLLGRAAGHADRLSLKGTAGAQARHHFQAEITHAGACALAFIHESRRRQGQPKRASQEIADEIARRHVLTGQDLQIQGQAAPAGHAAAGLGAAVVAIGAALPTPLDDQHMRELDSVLERVLAHAIAAAART